MCLWKEVQIESEVLFKNNLWSTKTQVGISYSGISLHLIPLWNACSPAVWNMLMSRLLSAVAWTTMQSYEVHHSQWALCWHQDDMALTQSTLTWQRPALCPSWSHAWGYNQHIHLPSLLNLKSGKISWKCLTPVKIIIKLQTKTHNHENEEGYKYITQHTHLWLIQW